MPRLPHTGRSIGPARSVAAAWRALRGRHGVLAALCLAVAGCQSLAIPDFNWRQRLATAPAQPAHQAPRQPDGQAAAQTSAGAPAASTTGAVPSLPPPVPAAQARFAFAPLSGPPQPVADRLAAAVARHSGARNLQLTGAGDPAATYLVKGYLSLVPDDDMTRLAYVWDVLGPDRRRLHRISGWTAIAPAGGTGWGDVGPAALDTVAAAALDALAAWIGAA